VRTLVSEKREAGAYEVMWDGRTNRGGQAPAGVYLVELISGGQRSRYLLLKIR
jgi:hypothetical protein